MKERFIPETPTFIQGKTKVLGKRAFAGPVKSRKPYPNLLVVASTHAFIQKIQQAIEIPLDAVRNDILLDFLLEELFLPPFIGNHLLDSTVDRLRRVKELSDLFQGHGLSSNMDRTVIAVFGIDA